MNKILVFLGVIVLLVVGVYAINKMQTPPQVNVVVPTSEPSVSLAPPSETAPSTAATITYTDSGFSPSSVTIKNGETVQWINKSSAKMWVASNPHPTHTDYPGFDELSSAANGGTYEFTFTKVGSWGFHNHNNPSDGGTVVVQ